MSGNLGFNFLKSVLGLILGVLKPEFEQSFSIVDKQLKEQSGQDYLPQISCTHWRTSRVLGAGGTVFPLSFHLRNPIIILTFLRIYYFIYIFNKFRFNRQTGSGYLILFFFSCTRLVAR